VGPGSGTHLDPYDGSTQAKFDALMASFQNTTDLIIHLGIGTFRSDVAPNRWSVKSQWTIEGAGMDLTTCQMTGNLKGRHFGHIFFNGNSNVSNVIIRDLTVDCNWAQLAATADAGLKGEKNVCVSALSLEGSHNLIERVRQINNYGSWANKREGFGIRVGAPKAGNATSNIIRNCRAELPHGNYSSPFALHGRSASDTTPVRYITNSSVYGNYAEGQRSGLMTGFFGGVNSSYLKNCSIYSNTFVDCGSVFYIDTGTAEGVKVLNNTLTRGWLGVGLVAKNERWTKRNIEIRGNDLNLENRQYISLGIWVSGSASSDVAILQNQISFSPTGNGSLNFRTIGTANLEGGTISDNTANEASAGVGTTAAVKAYDITISNNKKTTGGFMTGLGDRYIPPLGKAMNFSTRATVGTGENVLINGFIVTGTEAKKVLLRAIGPSLSQYGVTNPVPDPTLELYNEAGALLARNDNWRSSQQAAIQATNRPPSNNAESAILATLWPGNYTAVMSGNNSAMGVGLAEVYDLAPTDRSALQNVSTRGFVATGQNVIIGGLIVGQGQPPTVVSRAIGPSLSKFGINNPLLNPMLELRNANGALMAANDNWKDTQADAINDTGLAPTDAREAAIVKSLPPGNYTTILRGVGNSTGVALVELYRLQ
jgi:hypothetical protein